MVHRRAPCWSLLLVLACVLQHPTEGPEGDSAARVCGHDGEPCCPGGRCEAGTVCDSGGLCLGGCPRGQVTCGGRCVDTGTDNRNCGGCARPCSPVHGAGACEGGACRLSSCEPDFADCNRDPRDGCEADLRLSNAHCGACGNACAFPHATAECRMGTCALSACELPWADCNRMATDGCEVNTQSSAVHCGRCDNRCVPVSSTSSACRLGVCVDTTCGAGLGDCDGMAENGCETSLATSAGNCGACGNDCARPRTSAQCSAGRCAVERCEAGFGDCNSEANDGCETNLSVDARHCGRCGGACMYRNGTGACMGGSCRLQSCRAGFGNCDREDGNGCEVDHATDGRHCGTCGNACTYRNGVGACVAGVCRLMACNAGFGNCNRDDSDGCELALTSATNCGACGMACNFPRGVGACMGGACRLMSCNSNYGDCNANPMDGCETDLRTTLAHCGMCNRLCARANATANCRDGACSIGSCGTGFGNCDGMDGNGCEQALNTLTHCGMCGRTCSAPAGATATCTGGSCGFTCMAGMGDCDRMAGNGCEIDLTDDLNHCGACGQRCAPARATGQCVDRVCRVSSCEAGYDDCNMMPMDGCESNIQTDVNHCGGCRNRCVLNNGREYNCMAGMCSARLCLSGFGDCDNVAANGCETNVTTTAEHCSRCGSACPPDRPVCTSSMCVMR